MDQLESFRRFSGTQEVQMDLKRRSIRAFGYMFSSSAGQFVLRMGSTAILARLLVPEHFGLFMMTTAVTAIADNFRDLGLSTATIQREKVTHREVSNLFWINALAGLLLTVVVCGSAPLVAAYFSEPRLAPVTMALSVNFLLGGLTVQHEALLTRQMKHGQKAFYQLLGFFLGVVVAIVLARHGFGYWALVWREITRSACIMLGAWSRCRWIPGLPDRKTGVRGLVGFGASLSLANILGVIASSVDRLLIGRFFGADVVALYRQPYQLVAAPVNQFMGPLYQVSLPGLSMLQGDPDRFRRYYRKVIATVAAVSMPLSAFLAVYAPEIALLLLGDQWTGAAVFFQIFALGGFVRAVGSIPGFVLVSQGRGGDLLKVSLLISVVRVCLMSLGVLWGAAGVAWGEFAGLCVLLLPVMHYCFRGSPVTIREFFLALARPAAASIIMGLALLIIRASFRPDFAIVSVAVGALAGAVILFAAWFSLPGGAPELQALRTDILSAMRRKPMAPPPVSAARAG